MLKKMTLSASMCWAIICPLTQNPPLVQSCRANVGPTTELQLLKLKCWTSIEYGIPNVGPKITSYLGY